MKWFTSDWHLGEDRIGLDGKPNLFYRPFVDKFGSDDPERIIYLQNECIWASFNSSFKDGDELWHLGDVMYSERGESIEFLESIRRKYPNSKFNLIAGNYDEDKIDKLKDYFDVVYEDYFVNFDFGRCYLNHYPVKCRDEVNKLHGQIQAWNFGITGHIHGLWKVQRNMINVGVDAWHFKPVSEDEIKFCWNAMQNHYDENVFPY